MVIPDVLEDSFRLACFMVHDRGDAIVIVGNALEKLDVLCIAERKRFYWRDKFLKRNITRIARDYPDALQWLILFESELFMSGQEYCRFRTAQDLLVRYVNLLVRSTVSLSSFHVSVALGRLLYDYTTLEVQHIYEALTERYLGGDEYRRAKSQLLKKVQESFAGFLHVQRTSHGELRFDPSPDQNQWRKLVRDCLEFFTPWSTKGSCWATTREGENPLPVNVTGKGRPKVEQDRIETNRCHALIHPGCFKIVAEVAGVDAPELRLCVPRFYMESNGDDRDQSREERDSYSLTNGEQAQLLRQLGQQAKRRRTASPDSLHFRRDGEVLASFDNLDRSQQCVITLPAYSGLLEVWGRDEAGEFLLGTQLLNGISRNLDPSGGRVDVRRGTVELNLNDPDQDGSRRITIAYEPRTRAWVLAPSGWSSLKPALSYGAAAIALVVSGWLLGYFQHSTRSNQPERSARITPTLGSSTSTGVSEPRHPAIISVDLVPDDLRTRGMGGAEMPALMLPGDPALLRLKLPLPRRSQGLYRATLFEFPSQNMLLAEEALKPNNNSSLPMIEMYIPSTLLRSERDYTVILNHSHQRSTSQAISSFTFHVSARSQ